ncbi:MAG: heavy metal transporter [Microbacterium sp.]|jgi:copper chaperone CopZ|uniref:heavy-metal-associated domain-containing protein n=1 Tax=Microbacterium sp. TaxID=51671 RepID=UPI0008D96FB0|nr:heavy metal-associated domain-containing protein [Microbacterium sp.]MAY48435.1 heavy metal transporter [Microbacterium sp.]HAM12236.1 heavy metal transporter [Microbacterium sp.]HAS32885.1 heavy metal transporter [Microbacterium sp.]HBR87925.1 heavy-metal-associated domain-containing protein [Microbacterium sp.]|tara:strand:+ start:3805 stop:4131 length:327 start_codon:yes stop_codon:yes gene_type:complete
MTESIDLGLKDINASCACCVTTSSTTDASASTSAAVTTDVLVAGMTCSHCVSSVTEELSAIDGVESVAVDLNAGGISRVTIHSATPIDTAAVQAAVEDAGYSLASAPA